MIIRNHDSSASQTSGPCFFKKPCRWNFSIPDQAARQLSLCGLGKAREEEVLKYASSALHRRWILSIASLTDRPGSRSQLLRITGRELQVSMKDDPVLMHFEHAFAVMELAFRVAERRRAFTIGEVHALYPLLNGLPISAGVSIDC